MKGFTYNFREKKNIDLAPCFFCVHREKPAFEQPCESCIGNEDIALHHLNSETEFTHFEAISEAHRSALLFEQEKYATKNLEQEVVPSIIAPAKSEENRDKELLNGVLNYLSELIHDRTELIVVLRKLGFTDNEIKENDCWHLD